MILSESKRWDGLAIHGLWVILIAGVVIRLGIYIHNRSLWQDEAALAANIVGHSWGHLLGRLDYKQVAPPLFLLLSKLVYQLIGHLEYSLRLLPLLVNCASLYLISRILLRLASPPVAAMTLSLCAFGYPYIDWATNFKHYSSDLFCALLIVLAVFHWQKASDRTRCFLAISLPLLLWLSYTSGFLLVGLVFSVFVWSRKEPSLGRARPLLLLIGSLVVNAAFLYAIVARHSLGHSFMLSFWAKGFPRPPLVAWFAQNLFGLFGAPCRLFYGPALAFAICLFGFLRILRKQSPAIAHLMAGTLVAAIIASFLRVYPFFGGRLTAYWSPLALLMFAACFDGLERDMPRSVFRTGALYMALSIAVISAAMTLCASPSLISREEMRDVGKRLEMTIDASTPVFTTRAASAAFEIYGEPLIGRRAIKLKSHLLDARDFAQTWRRSGAPRKFWLIISSSDFEDYRAFWASVGQYCEVVDVIKEARSAAVLYVVHRDATRRRSE